MEYDTQLPRPGEFAIDPTERLKRYIHHTEKAQIALLVSVSTMLINVPVGLAFFVEFGRQLDKREKYTSFRKFN